MEPKKIPQVRASTLQNYLNVARFTGLDPLKILKSNHISLKDLENFDAKLPAISVVKLYEDSATASRRQDFGLLMAESRSFASLGPISLLLRYQPTVRAIVRQVVQNVALLNDINRPQLVDDGQMAMIRMELSPGFALRQTIELAVASACRMYRELMAGAWQPEAIHFRHSSPASLATHRRVLRCPIVFDSDFDGIVCSSVSLDVSNPWADPAMASHAQRFIDMLSSQRPPNSVTEQARQAILLLISSGKATKEKVAENLAVHPRSLQRLLSQEQTNFGELLGAVKRDLALRYLNGSNHSVTDIALLLGYSTISSFTRWFSEEFGKPPAAWRKAGAHEFIEAVTAKAA